MNTHTHHKHDRAFALLGTLSAALTLTLALRVATLATPAAKGEMVSNVGEYVAMTTKSGNEEVLAVLDNRDELLLIYKVVNQSKLEIMGRESLPALFAAARGQAGG